MIGYKRNQMTFTQESPDDGYAELEATAESTEKLSPFVSYKTKPSFIFNSKFAWGIEVSYGTFSLNHFRAENTFDGSNILYISGFSSRVTKIVNEFEFEDDIQGTFGYLMPSLAYMLGSDDTYIKIGVGYGLGMVELKKISSKAKKHLVTISFEDGQIFQSSLAEFGATYSSPFEDTSGYSAAYRMFVDIRWGFVIMSMSQGGPQWSDGTSEMMLEDTEFKLGLIIDL